MVPRSATVARILDEEVTKWSGAVLGCRLMVRGTLRLLPGSRGSRSSGLIRAWVERRLVGVPPFERALLWGWAGAGLVLLSGEGPQEEQGRRRNQPLQLKL